jgi:hypothetical protein
MDRPRAADIPPGIDDLPPTDESGDVDLSLLDYYLSLTLAERARRHYHARLFAERMRQFARRRYGSIVDDLEALE